MKIREQIARRDSRFAPVKLAGRQPLGFSHGQPLSLAGLPIFSAVRMIQMGEDVKREHRISERRKRCTRRNARAAMAPARFSYARDGSIRKDIAALAGHIGLVAPAALLLAGNAPDFDVEPTMTKMHSIRDSGPIVV